MPDTLRLAMTGEADITFTRRFDASPRVVWRAMTEPELILRWLWATHIPMTVCEQDFRVGGTLRWVWQRPDGSEMGLTGRYLEIEPPRRLVNTELFDEDWTGGETTVTTELDEVAPQTTLMRMTVRYASPEARERAAASPMAEGMEEGYARLDTLLSEFLRSARRSDFRIASDGARRIVVTRSFSAPPARVREAHLDPVLVQKWLGSEGFPIKSVEIDARQGGRFHYEWVTPDGSPLIVSGTFREIGATRIVHDELFEPDWTGGMTTVVTDFIADGTGTKLRVEITYSSEASRDAVLKSGMGEGMAGSYDQLDGVL